MGQNDQPDARSSSGPDFTTRTFNGVYGLPSEAQVTIEVFDLAGRRVSVERLPGVRAGWHRYALDGRHLASGVYLYRVSGTGLSVTKKMVIARSRQAGHGQM